MLTRLPHRVTIQAETRTLFEGGAYTTSWTTQSTKWANVQIGHKGMYEDYDNEKKQQYTNIIVTMRRDKNITNENRILFEGATLIIEADADPTNRGRMMKLRCRDEVERG